MIVEIPHGFPHFSIFTWFSPPFSTTAEFYHGFSTGKFAVAPLISGGAFHSLLSALFCCLRPPRDLERGGGSGADEVKICFCTIISF